MNVKPLLFLILLVSSCSIHQRRYMPGYDLQWKQGRAEARVIEGKSQEELKEEENGLSINEAPLSTSIDDKEPLVDAGITAGSSEVVEKEPRPVISLLGDTLKKRKTQLAKAELIDKYAHDARVYGIVSITGVFYLGILAIVPAIIAIHKANIVLLNKDSVLEQRRKARTGKQLGVITILIMVAAVIMVFALFNLSIAV